MARFVICAVKDAAVRAFNQPLFFRSKDEARRSFGDGVADAKSGFASHAADYDLWCLGEWDDVGDLRVYDVPERLCAAVDFIPYEIGARTS